MPTSNFQPIRLLDVDCCYKLAYSIANSADPDQLASADLHCLQRQGISEFSRKRVNSDKQAKQTVSTEIRILQNVRSALFVTYTSILDTWHCKRLFIPTHTIVKGYYGYTLFVLVSIHVVCPSVCIFIHF